MRFFLISFSLVFCVIIIRLFTIQVLTPYKNTHDYLQTYRLQPQRGNIYDTKGRLLAGNEITYTISADPKYIENKEEFIKKVDKILKVGEATLESAISIKKRWVLLKNNVNPETKIKLEKLKLSAIFYEEKPRRFYPDSSLAAHLLGFVGKNEQSDNIGYFGIEGFYEKELSGLPGYVKSERDVMGRPIFIGTQEHIDSEDGRDLYLTIDIGVQNILKKRIARGVDEYQAKEGCAVAVNPNTLELLGLACVPDFAPEEYYKGNDKLFRNWITSSLYEPGSTFKPLIVAAALEEGVIKENSIFDEDGPLKIGENTIKNSIPDYRGKIDVTTILQKSSNIGMVKIGRKLGRDKLIKWLNLYRFGELTNIDLYNEVSIPIKEKQYWYEMDQATVTFGQGIAITPIQLLRGFSALINGGYLMQPYVVRDIVERDGKVRSRGPMIVERIFSQKTSDTLRQMLKSVVHDSKDGKFQIPEGYQIGGKSGTAQIAVDGKYDAYRTIASFIGFAPVQKPQFAVLVIMREPEVSRWGSDTSGQVFFQIVKDLLVYYNVAPD